MLIGKSRAKLAPTIDIDRKFANTTRSYKEIGRFGVYVYRKTIVRPMNWALSNSLNAYNRHSDWHKLEVYATKMSIHF